MPETINLIPQEERIQQTKTKVVKLSTILSVILLIVVAGVGGYFYYKAYTLRSNIKDLDSSITNLRTEISSLSEIEIQARNLYKKSTILQSIFNERIYYSTLLTELEASIPDGVDIQSFGLGKESTIVISGNAATYNYVQELTNRLLERDIFTSVALNSVGLQNKDDSIIFFIVVTYDEDLLHE
jgi:Tfp pilus assembly protein PilN